MRFSKRLVKALFSACILLAGPGGKAACLNPLGCVPKDYDSCMADATTRPTELGVKLAASECFKRWKKPESDNRAAVELKSAELRTKAWESISPKLGTAGAWIILLGAPDMVTGPAACTPDNKTLASTDFYGLRRQGRSDRKILNELQQMGRIDFDLARARRDGHTDHSIIDALSQSAIDTSISNRRQNISRNLCYIYLWADGRPARQGAYFRAEFFTDKERTVAGYWHFSLEAPEL